MSLRELERNATPGPWSLGGMLASGIYDSAGEVTSRRPHVIDFCPQPRTIGAPFAVVHNDQSRTQQEDDAALIAALRNAAPHYFRIEDLARRWLANDGDSFEENAVRGKMADALKALDSHLSKP